MIRVETYPPQQPPERNPAIEVFIVWRNRMAELQHVPRGAMIVLGSWYNLMSRCREELAPWEWIWCPDCGGRGLRVDGGNHWCPRCSGTSILLAEELTDPAEITLVHKTAPPPYWGRLPSGQR